MKYKIKYLKQSTRDLEEVISNLSQYSKAAAASFAKKYRNNVLLLQEFPRINACFDGDSRYRRIIIDDYCVYYLVDEKNKTVAIYRVLSSYRDVTRCL